MLIKSYEERMARQATRHELVLRFLRDETWTAAHILACLLDGSAALVSKTMQQLKSRGFVTQYRAEGCRSALWGITSHGLAHAWGTNEDMAVRPYFEPSRLSSLAIPHKLDVQQARLRAERAGWSDWRPENTLPAGMEKRPDALVVDTNGQVIAIEMERHIKTLKRYEAVFSAYLQAIKRGELEQVHYVTPDNVLAVRLSRVLGLIKAVPLLGERVLISDRHRARFLVTPLSSWPPPALQTD
jgi:hypothetical protein